MRDWNFTARSSKVSNMRSPLLGVFLFYIFTFDSIYSFWSFPIGKPPAEWTKPPSDNFADWPESECIPAGGTGAYYALRGQQNAQQGAGLAQESSYCYTARVRSHCPLKFPLNMNPPEITSVVAQSFRNCEKPQRKVDLIDPRILRV